MAAVLGGLPLQAATVTTFSSSDRLLDSGSTYCMQTSATVASCSITADFADPTQRNTAHAEVGSAAQFGAVSGSLFLGMDRSANASGGYAAYFSDYLTIAGGAGSGTFISHYALTSEGEEDRFPFFAFSPSYRMVQGSVTAEPILLLPPGAFGAMPHLEASIDVTSTFEFGTPFWFGAGTQLDLSAINTGSSVSWSSTSSSKLVLTGYSVLDAQGQIAGGAQVTRSFIEGPNVFIPEPATWMLWLPLLLAAVFIRFRASGSAAHGPPPAIR